MTAQRDSLHEASQVLIGRLGHTVEQQIEKLNTLVQQEYERRAQVIINRIALVIIALLVVIYFTRATSQLKTNEQYQGNNRASQPPKQRRSRLEKEKLL
jgi:hypothetical protein